MAGELVDPEIAVVAPTYETRFGPRIHLIADGFIFRLKSALTLVVIPGGRAVGGLFYRCFHVSFLFHPPVKHLAIPTQNFWGGRVYLEWSILPMRLSTDGRGHF